MSQGTVCVIIAACNASGTIARAIASALKEPQVREVIVVDDASSDDTVQVARFADDGTQRLHLLVQRANNGPAAARNRALAQSTADWVCVLDADDFFLPGRMAQLLAYASQADLIADNMWQVQENAVDGLRTSLLDPPPADAQMISFETFVLSNVTRVGRYRGELGFIKPLMRRDFLTHHQLRYQEHMRLGEDYELYARALALGARLLLTPVQAYVSVVRASSLSGNHTEHDLLHLRECDAKLAADLPLTPRQRKALRRHYLSVDCRLQWRRMISAVQNKNPIAAASTLCRPLPVPFYVLHKLSAEAYHRAKQRLQKGGH